MGTISSVFIVRVVSRDQPKQKFFFLCVKVRTEVDRTDSLAPSSWRCKRAKNWNADDLRSSGVIKSSRGNNRRSLLWDAQQETLQSRSSLKERKRDYWREKICLHFSKLLYLRIQKGQRVFLFPWKSLWFKCHQQNLWMWEKTMRLMWSKYRRSQMWRESLRNSAYHSGMVRKKKKFESTELLTSLTFWHKEMQLI